MKKLQCFALAAAAFLMTFAAQAQTTATNSSFTSVNSLIPDGNATGFTSATNWSGIAGTITGVTVSLDITGGFNGDLYAYLLSPTGQLVVLLNRSGISAGNAFGYSDAGMNITLNDGGSNLHYYQNVLNPSGAQLTGDWAPDGRNIAPNSTGATFDSTSPNTALSDFNNSTANGAWTLFVADLSNGGQATLVSWGLTVVTVPEPQTWALLAGGVGILFAINRRRKL